MVIADKVIVIWRIEEAVHFDGQEMKVRRQCVPNGEYCRQGPEVYCYKYKIYVGIHII